MKIDISQIYWRYCQKNNEISKNRLSFADIVSMSTDIKYIDGISTDISDFLNYGYSPYLDVTPNHQLDQ